MMSDGWTQAFLFFLYFFNWINWEFPFHWWWRLTFWRWMLLFFFDWWEFFLNHFISLCKVMEILDRLDLLRSSSLCLHFLRVYFDLSLFLLSLSCWTDLFFLKLRRSKCWGLSRIIVISKWRNSNFRPLNFLGNKEFCVHVEIRKIFCLFLWE